MSTGAPKAIPRQVIFGSRRFVFLHELVGVTVDEPPSLFFQPKRLGDTQFHDG